MSDADEALAADLAAFLAPKHEPPPEVLAAARSVLTWRSVDAELAALTHDSLVDGVGSGARYGEQPRILTFTAADLSVEVEVESSGAGRRLVGQVVPPRVVSLELRAGEEVWRTESDELGRFVLALPARPRLARLRVTSPDGPVLDCAAVVV